CASRTAQDAFAYW
nr:immunoglobulin heavy chain junction region [Mus musculus]